MSVCFKEGIKINSEALTDIITAANQDVRQVLHNLSLWATKDKGLTPEQAKEDSAKAKKSLKMVKSHCSYLFHLLSNFINRGGAK